MYDERVKNSQNWEYIVISGFEYETFVGIYWKMDNEIK